jgi:hypothetical protein
MELMGELSFRTIHILAIPIGVLYNIDRFYFAFILTIILYTYYLPPEGIKGPVLIHPLPGVPKTIGGRA